MNVVFLSPHFPPHYAAFCAALRQAGANVLGVSDEPYEKLAPELRAALTEYYKVGDLHHYDELVRALGWLTHKYGKLDRLDSLNEYWLETEARLRTDFNIVGIRTDAIATIKRKSRMKERFATAGVAVARGRVVHSADEARSVARELGYPLVAKPDIGVGAGSTFRIDSDADLERLIAHGIYDYILEELIVGEIETFDGLVDREGQVVFCASMVYSRGIMETVNEDTDIYYYTRREIPADTEEAGRRTLAAFGVRERFFHFEFFRRPDGALVALEVNMRPPGGFTVDMFNYSADIDLYRAWAQVVVEGTWQEPWERSQFVCYASRKHHLRYRLDHRGALAAIGTHLVLEGPISGVFRQALGDHGYIFRAPELGTTLELARLVMEKA